MEMPVQGEFCWAELATNDLDGATEFYRNVFGWEVHVGDNSVGGMDYREFNIPGGERQGGMYDMKVVFGDHPPPPHFVNYVAVDDVEAMAARAVELGGKCCHPPQDIPNVGRMVTIMDPSNATIVLIQLNQIS